MDQEEGSINIYIETPSTGRRLKDDLFQNNRYDCVLCDRTVPFQEDKKINNKPLIIEHIYKGKMLSGVFINHIDSFNGKETKTHKYFKQYDYEMDFIREITEIRNPDYEGYDDRYICDKCYNSLSKPKKGSFINPERKKMYIFWEVETIKTYS